MDKPAFDSQQEPHKARDVLGKLILGPNCFPWQELHRGVARSVFVSFSLDKPNGKREQNLVPKLTSGGRRTLQRIDRWVQYFIYGRYRSWVNSLMCSTKLKGGQRYFLQVHSHKPTSSSGFWVYKRCYLTLQLIFNQTKFYLAKFDPKLNNGGKKALSNFSDFGAQQPFDKGCQVTTQSFK